MSTPRRGDIDAQYNAIRARLGSLPASSSEGGSGAGGALKAHTHSADQITFEPGGLLSAEQVQAALDEHDTEKLARDGTQTMLGALDMDHHSISNADDADIEGTATVGEDVVLTEGVGGAEVSGVRQLHLTGGESDGEGKVDGINALAFNAVTPTSTLGHAAWDATEDALVIFVQSGAVLVAVASSWAVKLAVVAAV